MYIWIKNLVLVRSYDLYVVSIPILKSKVLDDELKSLEKKTGMNTGYAIQWTPNTHSKNRT